MCAGYICLRVICAKIWYRLETIGVHCNRLLRQDNERQDYWYRRRYSNKYRPISIPTNIGEYQPIPDTGIGLTLLYTVLLESLWLACCILHNTDTIRHSDIRSIIFSLAYILFIVSIQLSAAKPNHYCYQSIKTPHVFNCQIGETSI